MREEFLYYIWQHQLFRKKDLMLIDGSKIEIIQPGFRNLNNGPDFIEAHILIDGIRWYGSVEMHVKASDWHRHNHQHDPHFENVILHVVFLADKTILNRDQSIIPCLELKGVYKPKVYHRYMNLIEHPGHIPCEDQIHTVNHISRLLMLEVVLIERLKRKSETVEFELKQTQFDWEEVTFRMLAKGMGFKINGEGMLALSRLLSIKKLVRLNSLFQIEAMLLGTAGFLDSEPLDSYHLSLKEEYGYLRSKYAIEKELEIHYWKFSPLRPANFPVFRIAQLAAVIYYSKNLWDLFQSFSDVESLVKKLQLEPSEYWKIHHRLGRVASVKGYKLSKSAINHLLINVTAPMLMVYSRYTDQIGYQEKALSLLSMLPKEENRVTRQWRQLNWQISSAFDSQGLNELFHEYCQQKKCLSCKIGNQLLRIES